MGDNGPLPLLEVMRAFQERYASAQQERRERERREPKLPPRFEDASETFSFAAADNIGFAPSPEPVAGRSNDRSVGPGLRAK